ncbi:MAG TPA: primosomal protein N' [Nitrospiraceae bacterium]|nr:primosomal protein N' [Nitrospiraceae bacterium]
MPIGTGEMDASPRSEAFPCYADVIVPRGPNRSFTYFIPSALRTRLTVGQRVTIPFRSTIVAGVVTALHHELPSGIEKRHLKEIHALTSEEPDAGLSRAQLELSRWLSERFLAPWGQCVKLVAQAIPSRKTSTKWSITPEGRQSLNGSHRLSPDRRRMLERLARRPSGLSWETLKRGFGQSALRVRAALARRGLIAPREIPPPTLGATAVRLRSERHRPAFSEPCGDGSESGKQNPAPLPPDIRRLWDSEKSETVVLQAGREERLNILLQAITETLGRKRRVLVLTGEVSRAQELAGILTRVGITDVLLFHGDLSPREKAFVWQLAASDSVNVVVGTRSGACMPVQDLGLVWVEGEEDAALKEEQSPRYHAREIARRRAQLDRAVLVLASAHPSLESLHAGLRGHARPWSVPADRKRISVEAIDLRQFPGGTFISPPVIESIRAALTERELVVLFLNRRGYASLLHCRACGEAPSCPACGMALRFHKQHAILMCHSCGCKRGVPDTCPACQAARLEPLGAGTERVEEILRRHFPQSRIGRMDRETIRRGAQAKAFLSLARGGDIDVIIGTQMLFVHGEMPSAGLVVVLNADVGLHLPDFRSAEQAYHGLQDAVSLLDTKRSGTCLIQTYLPHHHAVQSVVHDNPSLFIDTELAFREALAYPPFAHLIRLDVSGTSERHVKFAAERWAAVLRGKVSTEAGAGISVSILGPAPAPRPRLRGRYYWRLLVRSPSQGELLKVVRNSLSDVEKLPRSGGIRCSIDVDPVTML